MIELTKKGFILRDEAAFYTDSGITDDFDHEFQIAEQLIAKRIGWA